MSRPVPTQGMLRKVKLPNELEFAYAAELVAADDFGTWLLLPAGGCWSAPHDHGRLPFASVVLLPRVGHWVAWWIDRSPRARLQIDVARPAISDAQGWRYMDLELDIFADRSGAHVVLLDEDDLRDRVLDGTFSRQEAADARRAADELIRALPDQPAWVRRGWELLAQA